MSNPDYLISTPENVDLHLELAGLGNRVYAGIIDNLLIGLVIFLTVVLCVLAVIGIELMPVERDSKTIIYYYLVGIAIFVVFLVNFGYFIFFEGTWQGQTPGKRLAQIRVIEANGQPVTWASVCIRNLLRIIDQGLAFIGVLPMIIDRNERRFGDLAAGTMVIRERLPALSQDKLNLTATNKGETFVDSGQITPDEYELLLTFLKRRQALTQAQRPRLASSLADYFRTKLNVPADSDPPELFLEKLYLAYVERARIAAE